MDQVNFTTLQQTSIDNQLLLLQELNKYTSVSTEKEELQKYQFYSLINSSNQLFLQLRNLQLLCTQVRSSLQATKQSNLNGSGDNSVQQPQKVKQIPVIIIKDIKNIVRTKEIDISNVANKLKVFVSKVMQKQSSKLKYNYTCFINHAMQQLIQFDFDQGFQKMREEFNQIRQKFNVVNSFVVKLHRIHYTTFFLTNSPVDAFVSFYIQKLLFIQEIPLPFNGNLLFVPITLIKLKNKQTSKYIYTQINSWYINQLNKQNSNWENFSFELFIKNTGNSEIKYYFIANFQKKGAHQNQTCLNLRKIRCFVYFSLLFNYLKNALAQYDQAQNKKQIQIKLNEKYTLIVSTQKKHLINNGEKSPEIFSQFLKYFDEVNIRKRKETNKIEIGTNLINFMVCTLAKINYKVNIPEQYINLRPKYIYVGEKRVQL